MYQLNRESKKNITLETYDHNDQQYIISDATPPRFSNHYSEEGSGFGYLTFSLRRRSDINYFDVGHGYKVVLRKGPRHILFKGKITKIDESSEDVIEVSAVGYNTLLSFDIKNFVLSDRRVNRWVAGCNNRGSFRPDKFDHSLNWTELINEGGPNEEEISHDGIEITPRRGVDYNDEDYYYLRYRFEFGEIATRLTGTYELDLPNNWPGKVQILDANENVLFENDISSNGTLDLDVDNNVFDTFVEIRFEVTADGLNTAEEGTVFFRFYNIRVYSTDDTPDATAVIKEIAEHMRINYGFAANSLGNAPDTSLIDDIGYELPQAAFDEDKTLDEVMKEAVKFGDGLGNPLAWGVAYDDTNRMFLEKQDLSTVRYKILESEEYEVTGDLSESYQKVYGRYTDPFGQTVRTDVQSADSEITALGGLYRKEVIELNDVTSGQADVAVSLALNENKSPKISTDFQVSGFVLGESDEPIPVEDIVSGSLVQVPQFRAREATVLDDKRKGYYSFMLKTVEVDLEKGTAKLIPAGDRSSFESYMELIRRLRE